MKARRLLKSKGRRKRKSQKHKRFWLRPHLRNNARHTLGDYYQLILPSKIADPELFHKLMRMSAQSFEKLVELVRPLVERQFVVREPISVEERVALTIR